jgi:hypothetical protein
LAVWPSSPEAVTPERRYDSNVFPAIEMHMSWVTAKGLCERKGNGKTSDEERESRLGIGDIEIVVKE